MTTTDTPLTDKERHAMSRVLVLIRCEMDWYQDELVGAPPATLESVSPFPQWVAALRDLRVAYKLIKRLLRSMR